MSGLALPAAVGFVVALGLRLSLIADYGGNYSFDGFQRWAGRDHVLVQSWLPVTQSVIGGVAALGGGITDARIAISVIGALAAAAGVVLAGRMGGVVAAWAFLVPACYGPFVVWTAAPYQEGTFLLVLFAGLALALSDRWLAADLVIGLLGLVRYEGWPCVALYVAWRRDPRALVALWGMAAWITARYGLDLAGFHASPADFDDWEGMRGRTTPASWAEDAGRLFGHAWDSGGLAYCAAGAVGIATSWRRPGILLLVAIGFAQVAAVAGWLAGLEIATYRMLVVPVMLAGLLGAVGASTVWARLPGRLRPGLVLLGALLIYLGVVDAWRGARSESVRMAPERKLLAEMLERPDCDWVIQPRTGLGTRQRHDGCEILQGLGDARHGDGFWCAPWGPPPATERSCVADARWMDKRYVVAFRGADGTAHAPIGSGPVAAPAGAAVEPGP
ncbi:MAG: hypothetical protein Q8P18_07850 [Pseudomonadota bacterium]|nr:hypothetical protein [Pseudomonadota bacterium]